MLEQLPLFPAGGQRAARAAPAAPEPHRPSVRAPLEGFVTLMSRQGDWWPTEREVRVWTAAYPDVDLPGTWREMAAWLVANPHRLKTYRGMGAFVNRWLRTEQQEDR